MCITGFMQLFEKARKAGGVHAGILSRTVNTELSLVSNSPPAFQANFITLRNTQA